MPKLTRNVNTAVTPAAVSPTRHAVNISPALEQPFHHRSLVVATRQAEQCVAILGVQVRTDIEARLS